jgi:hypothetical protein
VRGLSYSRKANAPIATIAYREIEWFAIIPFIDEAHGRLLHAHSACCTAAKLVSESPLRVMSDRFVVIARCPLFTEQRLNRCAALSGATGHKQILKSPIHHIGVD